MNPKVATIGLLVACVALGAALAYRHHTAVQQQQAAEASILVLSNDLSRTSAKLSEQEKVNQSLETNLVQKTTEIEARVLDLQALTNQLGIASNTLAKTEADLKASRDETARRDARISELETQNSALDKQAADLKSAISGLEGRIASTEKKLATSEGEKSFLLKELQRLKAEKAELERQFNDLAVLREQVRKLKDELSIARRLDWIRRGIYGNQNLKGGERLKALQNPPAATPQTNGLNVEIKRDGGARILSPGTPATNPAPTAPPPPQ